MTDTELIAALHIEAIAWAQASHTVTGPRLSDLLTRAAEEIERMKNMTEATHYLLDPLSPLPARWRDKHGPLRVMAGPVKGWVMVRRPQAVPFCLRVSDLCNATRREPHGPFE